MHTEVHQKRIGQSRLPNQRRYGCGYLTFVELGRRDRGIFSACRLHKIPTAWNLAGGYTNPMDKTVAIHLQTLEASDATAGVCNL